MAVVLEAMVALEPTNLFNSQFQATLAHHTPPKPITLLTRLPKPSQTIFLIPKISITPFLSHSQPRRSLHTSRIEPARRIPVNRSISSRIRIDSIAIVILDLSTESFDSSGGTRACGKSFGVAGVFCGGGGGGGGGWVVVFGEGGWEDGGEGQCSDRRQAHGGSGWVGVADVVFR